MSNEPDHSIQFKPAHRDAPQRLWLTSTPPEIELLHAVEDVLKIEIADHDGFLAAIDAILDRIADQRAAECLAEFRRRLPNTQRGRELAEFFEVVTGQTTITESAERVGIGRKSWTEVCDRLKAHVFKNPSAQPQG